MFSRLLFIIFIAAGNIPPNAAKQHHSKGEEGNTTAIYSTVSIFSISRIVYLRESTKWENNYNWNIDWICTNDIQKWSNDGSLKLLVFPDEWMGNDVDCQWNNYSGAFSRCRNGLLAALQSTKTELFYIDDIYERKRDFNRRLLLKVLETLATKCRYHPNVKYKIRFFTNFAEKSLASALPAIMNNNSDLIDELEIVSLSIATANYYFRAINFTNNLVFQFYDRHINDGYLRKLNKNWHQIYVFGLSKNLTDKQLDKIKDAVKIPINTYFQQPIANRTEPISFMIVGKQQIYMTFSAFQFCDDEYFLNEECYKNLRLTKGVNFPAALIENGLHHITILTKTAIQNYYAKIFGAQLPPEQMADAIIYKQIQPKPRIVLITDYVEMKFLNSKLPNENGFEFKVYALNKVVAEHFQGRADVVIQMDPDKPPIIPFTREEEEFSYPTVATPKQEKVNSSIKTSFIILILIMFGSAAAIILFISTIILYRRKLSRLDWLHRLEQFKTQHLFDAYMNEKRMSGKEKEKAADCWEVGWNQILLTSEQLGQGAFGEVRKATFASSSAAEHGFILDKNNQSEFKVAVKMLPIHASEKAQKNFLQEMKIMKLLGNGHQCVVKMLGCMSKGEGAHGIVLEFCARGSLLDHLNKSKMAEGEERQKLCRPFSRWAWQIADGMVFLAGKNLVHRDLAARNVLLDENSIAKISDFGLCISLDEKLSKESDEIIREKLPIFLLAPECLERRQFSEKSDVWSFGLLLHEIYTLGINPFASIEFHKLIEYIREYRPKRPEMCPKLIFEIMQKCLLLDLVERPTFIEIREKLGRMLEKETVAYGYVDLEMPPSKIDQFKKEERIL